MKNEVFVNFNLTFKMGISMSQRFRNMNPNHQNDKHCKVPSDFLKKNQYIFGL